MISVKGVLFQSVEYSEIFFFERSATCLYSSNKFPSVDYADFALKKVDVPSTLIRKQTPVSAKIYASAKHPERDLDQVW